MFREGFENVSSDVVAVVSLLDHKQKGAGLLTFDDKLL